MGQINIDSKFGEHLFKLASDNQYNTYLEVGTWNGQGSTKCLMSGILQNNPNAKLYSLEANPNMFQQAKQFWSANYNQLILLHGTLHQELLSLDEIQKHPMFHTVARYGEQYKEWLENDRRDMNTSQQIVIPEETIDVIIIDGGEFSGMGDWKVLKRKNPKVVCLDDTSVIKSYYIREELLNSDIWEVIADEVNDRNGFSIFKRK